MARSRWPQFNGGVLRELLADNGIGYEHLPETGGKTRPKQEDLDRGIDRIIEIWTECLATYGGSFLFGRQRTMADAMYAPVCTRFLTYDVKLPKSCTLYCQTIMAMPEMKEWVAAAKAEPDEIDELEMDF